MGFPITMQLKKSGEKVDVYNFYENGSALVWNDNLVYKQNGCGWMDVKRKELQPFGFYMEGFNTGGKVKVNLIKATFECSDGTRFMSLGEGAQSVRDAKDKAVAHQRALEEKE